uniref:FAR1 domain-containing protein n=1 Tax=Arundo donax TaxID=35708 RepID=A0A0A9G2V2_ARUDO
MDAGGYVSPEEIMEFNFVVNQTFRREDEFFEFYNNYACKKDFSVRRGIVRKRPSTEEVIWRRFLCSCQGYRMVKYFDRSDKKGSHAHSPSADAVPGSMSRCVRTAAYGLLRIL